MPKSVTRLDLTKIPFGRSHNGIMIYEENNSDGESYKPGLYLSMRIQGGDFRRKGLVDLDPIVNGESVSYTYEATPGALVMNCAEGTVKVVIDTEKTMRICGQGVGIRLYTKIPFLTMELATMLPGGLADLNLMSINQDGGRFLFKALKGEVTVDSVFNVLLNGPEDAKVEFLPDENGEFEIAAYLMNPDEWGYIDYMPIDEAAAAVKANFDEFASVYPEVAAEWSELCDLCAYVIWMHRSGKNEREIIPTVKGDLIYTGTYKNGWANIYEQPLHAMAMSDTAAAVKLLRDTYKHMANGMLPASVSTFKTHYQASPATVGVAVLDIIEKGIDEEAAKELYGAMVENYGWWKLSHSFAAGRFSYNHRDEIALEGVSVNACEFPLETPDLYAYMALYAEAIAKLSAIVGDGKSDEWEAEKKTIVEELVKLWDGESFLCRAAVSGKTYKTNSVLAYVPVILGERLPAEVIEKLVADLGDENKFLSDRGFRSESKESALYDTAVEGRGAVVAWIQQLLISGLVKCGANDLVKKAGLAYLGYVKEVGARDVLSADGEQPCRRPGNYINSIACAAVIYIAGKLNG